jgi:hypothetical protein
VAHFALILKKGREKEKKKYIRYTRFLCQSFSCRCAPRTFDCSVFRTVSINSLWHCAGIVCRLNIDTGTLAQTKHWYTSFFRRFDLSRYLSRNDPDWSRFTDALALTKPSLDHLFPLIPTHRMDSRLNPSCPLSLPACPRKTFRRGPPDLTKIQSAPGKVRVLLRADFVLALSFLECTVGKRTGSSIGDAGRGKRVRVEGGNRGERGL